MRNRVVLFLFRTFIAVCFFSTLTLAHASESKPVAFIENDSYDFGEVFEGTDVTHVFIIKNNGNADLEIQNAKAG
jgi:hypothetical protein